MRQILAGVYQIICNKNGKFYIGSSNDITRRWWEHRGTLNRNKHWNARLQNAWNKYGECSFRFEIVEVCGVENRLSREQHWITETKCHLAKIGYNLLGLVDDFSDYNAKEYIVTQLDGIECKIRNLSDYCRKNGLDVTAMSQVSLGKLNQYKGYKCRPASMTVEEWEKSKKRHWKPGKGWKGRWRIIHPDGKEEIINSLTDFCKKKGLSQGNMTEIAQGRRKQHKKFRCEIMAEDDESKSFIFCSKTKLNQEYPVCKIENCINRARSKKEGALCETHYHHARREVCGRCSIDGCGNITRSASCLWCDKHYQQNRRSESLTGGKKTRNW